MKIVTVAGISINMPPRTRLGPQVERAIEVIIRSSPRGEAYYRALDLRGSAKKYGDRYTDAVRRVIQCNPHLFAEGLCGVKGGFGARLLTKAERLIHLLDMLESEGPVT